MDKNITSSVVKGALIGLLLVAFSLVIQVTLDMKSSQKFAWIQFAILFCGIIWSCVHYVKQMDGAVTYSNVFAYGFKVTALSTLITAAFAYISIKFIFPDMIEKSLVIMREEMENAKNQKLTEEQIDKYISGIREYFAVFAVGGSIFFHLVIGVVASLIGAGVAKKNPNAVGRNEINQIGS